MARDAGERGQGEARHLSDPTDLGDDERVEWVADGRVPDVRDGLTRLERVILTELRSLMRDYPGRNVPTATLYGRVVEHVDVDQREFLRTMSRLVVPSR